MGPALGSFLEIGSLGLFYVLLLAFAIHALFVSYHWFSYGSSRSISLIALALYLGGGAMLLLTMSIALSL